MGSGAWKVCSHHSRQRCLATIRGEVESIMYVRKGMEDGLNTRLQKQACEPLKVLEQEDDMFKAAF